MKLLNLGGACAVLEHEGKRMLLDPWLDEGIFHGAWHHFPPLKAGIEELGRVDYIFISHIHEDHCSTGTLSRLNKDAEVFILDREPNFVARFLQTRAFGFKKVHRIPPRVRHQLAPGLVVELLQGDPSHELSYVVDSMLVVQWGERVVFNANDCLPFRGTIEHLQSTYPRVDLALLPYAAGSGYPACYTNLSRDEKLAEAKRLRETRLAAFVENVRAINPTRAMPFADQYVVVGSRSPLNDLTATPTGPAVVRGALEEAGLLAKLLLLNSGQSYDLETGALSPAEPYHDPSSNDRRAYAEAHRDTVYEHEHFELSPSVSLLRLGQAARTNLWRIQQKRKLFPDFRLYLDAADRRVRLAIDLRNEQVEEVSWDAPLVEPFLRQSVPATLLMLMLVGHVSWNIADAALFIDYERRPNVYDPTLYALVNHLKI